MAGKFFPIVHVIASGAIVLVALFYPSLDPVLSEEESDRFPAREIRAVCKIIHGIVARFLRITSIALERSNCSRNK